MSYSNKKNAEGSKAKLYWIIGIVIAVVVAILLIWNSGLGQKNAVAATVGDKEYTVTEVSYYYKAVSNNFIQQAQMYASYGMDMGYDTNLSPSEQYYNEEEGITYADYFLDSALQELQRVTILESEAAAADYTLSEAGQASVDQNLNYLTMYSVQSGLTEDAYLKSAYGDNMNKSIFKELLTQSILADEYAQVKAETFTYSDEEMDAYYKENADSLDTYDYRVCYINYQTEEKTDEEGNTIEPTEEEIDAAMKEAGASAKAMVSDVRSGTAFNTAAAKYVAETSATAYTEDPDYNRQKDVLGSTVSSSLSSDVSAWILDAARSAGDITSIEIENSGYCVVQFLGRDKGDDSYQTATYRNIQILAKTDKNDDGTDAAPTEEQLNAAKEKADAIVEMWNDGDATADTFAELATKNSSDEGTKENGGLNEDANRDNLSSALTSWLFDRDRKAGDVGVVEYTDSTGTVVGYEVIYAEGFGQIRWEYQATNTLRSDDYQTWYAEVQENYPAELTEKGKEIPNL